LPPLANVVKVLTIALVWSRIAYGLLFWQPTKKQYQRMQNLILAPLRKVLSLPITTHRLSLLIDFQVPPLLTHRELLLLRFVHRCVTNTGVTASHTTIRPRLTHNNTSLVLVKEAQAIQQKWSIDIASTTTNTKVIQDCFQQQCLTVWNAESTYGLLLKSIKSQWTRSHYLYWCNKHTLVLTAALRHRRALLNQFLYSHKRSNSSACTDCGAAVEDAKHILFDCPTHTNTRNTAFTAIRTITGNTPTLALLLGSYPHMKDKTKRASLTSTIQTFLDAINSIRHFVKW
jgi:hypothetical protein